MHLSVGRAVAILAFVAAAAAIVWSLMPASVPIEIATVTRGRFTATVDGEQVIVYPSDRVASGVRVEVR